MEFLALVMAYGMRVSLSIAITEMAKPVIVDEKLREDTCIALNVHNKTEIFNRGEFNWDKELQVSEKFDIK